MCGSFEMFRLKVVAQVADTTWRHIAITVFSVHFLTLIPSIDISPSRLVFHSAAVLL